MGNQLVGISPSQIFPVEHYLTDLPEYQFDASLGSTRFLKVARARSREGFVVVKVFAIHDPSLPLKSYKDQLEEIKNKLSAAHNQLPFQKFMLTDKAGLLLRQYVKDNLYDRISTRPFLNHVEKKWIAFQILHAVNNCHKMGVHHGDIKLENIMVTGWNWVFLTDFASFKPTYLPDDNPADFSYFFDTSRRRSCYIAPERFVKTLNPEAVGGGSGLLLPDDEIKEGELIPSMDIFSVGCTLTEFFTEGHAPFDLSLLLAYRNGEYSPWKVLEKVDGIYFRDMLRHMMQKDPNHRLTAEEYLDKLRKNFFPEYFYTFLHGYLQRYATTPILSPDEKIGRLKIDLPLIMDTLCPTRDKNEALEENEDCSEGLVIIASFITSCLRALQQCTAKLQALSMLAEIAPHLGAEIILDRLTPYMLYLVNDPYPRVRSSALRTLTHCLTLVKNVPRSDANIFPEYILPHLAHLTQDPVVMVRIVFAENIAVLAETALRFLEMSQMESNNNELNDMAEESSVHYQASYDAELQALHEMIQQRVRTLLSDTDSIVKRTLMENGITRLCVFFGHQKANDVLLSHMITFLNDKEDRELRGTFFDCIVGVAAYIGWQSSSILKPLLQQGLSDTEEFVIVKAFNSMTNLTELGLLQKTTLYELMLETASFLVHPNLWIRHGIVGFICAVARSLNIADIHCKLLPVVQPFSNHPIIQVDKELILLSALKEPIPRAVYDGIVRSNHIVGLLDYLRDRQLVRAIARSGHPPNYGEIDSVVRMLHRRLVSEGMTDLEEDKLVLMNDCLLKIYKSRTSFDGKQMPEREHNGFIDLAIHSSSIKRNAELTVERSRSSASHNSSASTKARKKGVVAAIQEQPVFMNEEWQHMFGTTNIVDAQASAQQPQATGDAVALMTQSLPHSPRIAVPDGGGGSDGALNSHSPISISQLQKESASPKKVVGEHFFPAGQKFSHGSANFCQIELSELIKKKIDELHMDQVTKDLSNRVVWDKKFPQPSWKPKGLLVAHLHEHHSAVNRVLVIPDSTLFATCSNDGTVKIWDCERMEGKSVANRSRQTFSRQEGQIGSMAICQNYQSIASASDNCVITVFRYELANAKMSIVNTRHLDPQEEGCVVDMNYFDSGSQSILTYATVYGSIMGWDLRSPGVAWKLENDLCHGLITSFCVDPNQTWLCVGTSSGNHVCWDVRFQLPISCHMHPVGARVRRLVLHPLQQSWIVSAVQGNNEISMWDMETGARQMTLWASPAPPLSQTQSSNHAINAIQMWPGEESACLLTAGSDMRIRYWDLHTPSNSYIVVNAASDMLNPSLVSYRSRLIDGTEVIQEITNTPCMQATEDMPRRGPDAPPTGHNDSISDFTLCLTSQVFIISASRNGVVKVWK